MDSIFTLGWKNRCDQVCDDLNRLVPINNLGDLRWYAGYRYSRGWEAGRLTVSQQSIAENAAAKINVNSSRMTPLAAGLELEELDVTEPEGD